MRNFNLRNILKSLKKQGCVQISQTGSHIKFKLPEGKLYKETIGSREVVSDTIVIQLKNNGEICGPEILRLFKNADLKLDV